MNICKYMKIYTYINTHKIVPTRTSAEPHMSRESMHVCGCVHAHVCVCVCMFECVCTCVCVYVYVSVSVSVSACVCE